MAYNEQKHKVFSDRAKNFIVNLHQLYIEAGVLDDIYINEAVSGGDAAWTDTENGTADEHVNAILVMRRFRECLGLDDNAAALASQAQTSRMTPFLQ